MRLESVQSTCLAEIGYVPETRILSLRFHDNDTLYEYRDVPRSVYLELWTADSKGGFFVERIRPIYEYRKFGAMQWLPPDRG